MLVIAVVAVVLGYWWGWWHSGGGDGVSGDGGDRLFTWNHPEVVIGMVVYL